MKPQFRLQVSDAHIPFMDSALEETLLKQIGDLEPDGIDIIGDLIDCYMLSRFDKNPRRKHSIQEEIDRAVIFLGRLRGAAGDKCDIRYTEGNHENRLERMLWGNAKHLAPLRNLTIPELMELKKLGIRYYDPKAPYRIGNLWFLHGDVTRKQNFSKSPGGRAAADVAKAVGGSVLMGHTHQMGYSALRTWNRLLESYEIGCMVRYDLEYIVGVPPWQQGWSTADFTYAGHHSVDFIRVVEAERKRHVLYRGGIIDVLPPAKTHLRLEE